MPNRSRPVVVIGSPSSTSPAVDGQVVPHRWRKPAVITTARPRRARPRPRDVIGRYIVPAPVRRAPKWVKAAIGIAVWLGTAPAGFLIQSKWGWAVVAIAVAIILGVKGIVMLVLYIISRFIPGGCPGIHCAGCPNH